MSARTQSITLATTPEQAFSFIADPENLPAWAVHFARTVRREGDAWTVLGAEGPIALRLRTDAALGVIDWYMNAAPGLNSVAYSRILPHASGSEFVFTILQAPGMPDEAFERLAADLAEELAELRRVVA